MASNSGLGLVAGRGTAICKGFDARLVKAEGDAVDEVGLACPAAAAAGVMVSDGGRVTTSSLTLRPARPAAALVRET